MLTDKQKKICEKYSKRDENDQVHCQECPLAISHADATCRAFMHYDRKKHEWMEDDMVEVTGLDKEDVAIIVTGEVRVIPKRQTVKIERRFAEQYERSVNASELWRKQGEQGEL